MKKFLTLFLIFFITLATPAYANDTSTVTLKNDFAYLQESPSSPKIIYKVSKTDTIKIISQNGLWFNITCNDKVTGWIHYSFINSPIDERALKMVENAYSKIGCQYKYAHQGPNIFDCSGLIDWLVQQYEYPGNRVANLTNGPEYQINQLTYKIPHGAILNEGNTYLRNNLDMILKPGDVFYFTWDPTIRSQHAALYVGNNQIIHAKGTKYGVVLEKISDDYLSHTVAICRVFENGNFYIIDECLYNKKN